MKSIHTISIILMFMVFSAWGQAGAQPDFVVAADGSGDFTTVQGAIDAVPHLRKQRTIIFIKKGIYKEKLEVSTTKTNITLMGEEVQGTVLTYDDFAQKKNRFGEEMGTSGSASFYINGDGFVAENLTFENSSGPVGQAVAVRVDGDMVAFRNCRFLGFQDTLYPHGEESRQYYLNCYIEGTVDFIFGWSTAVFDGCVIFCKNTGYVTAASTLPETQHGFVFLDCRVHGSGKGTHYLGRPWRPYASVAFVRCDLSDVIDVRGWDNWGKVTNKATARFREGNNRGAGAGLSQRVGWMRQLTEEEMAPLTPEGILGNWLPQWK
ncbi:pectinesterase family protein [Breznakibacter xylanolyticus]|nr:pectinesterase family protein [Breznakibacter xylanolyticus]